MALFRGIQEYIALDANNITLVFDSGNIFLYPPQVHLILYKYWLINMDPNIALFRFLEGGKICVQPWCVFI